MTRDEGWEVMDMWWDRCAKLAEVVKNQSESDQKRTKAFILFTQMFKRVMNGKDMLAIKAFPIPDGFESGGVMREGLTPSILSKHERIIK